MTERNPFYKMIENLFLTNNLVLFGRIDTVSEVQQQEVVALIENYYHKESVDYTLPIPDFHKAAASWSATILFHAAQLVMYREHSAETLFEFFPKFEQAKSASVIVTSDLCLRFIPSILKYLQQIDKEDELIPILKNLRMEWHYSGLLSSIALDVEEFDTVLRDPCFTKLYIDRIIEHKKKEIGQREELKPLVLIALGNHRNEFWKDF